MRLTGLLLLLALLARTTALGQIKYENNFEKAQLDSTPEDFLVLDGAFAVKEVEGNKVLELPGAPLDTFGLLFGPTEKENISASARIFGAAKGRRFPVFDVGLNGVGGYKLRVSPGKKQIELYKGDTVKKAVPLEWQAGKWTHLKLQIVKNGESGWKIEGRIWQEGASESSKPTIELLDTEAPIAGRASISAMPYAGLPVWFDDLEVRAVAEDKGN
jgi:hypothetical protein